MKSQQGGICLSAFCLLRAMCCLQKSSSPFRSFTVRAKNSSPVMRSHFFTLGKEVSPSCLCSREKEEDYSSLPSCRRSRQEDSRPKQGQEGRGRDYPPKPPPGGQSANFIFAAENECTVYGMARFSWQSHPLYCSVHVPRSEDTFSWGRSLPPPEPERSSVVRPDSFKRLTAGGCGNCRSYLDIHGNSSQLRF